MKISARSVIPLLLLSAMWANANACDMGPAVEDTAAGFEGITKVSLASMSIKNPPIYLIDKSGRFFKFDLSKKNLTPISNHGFGNNRLDFTSSTDGHWIAYSGNLKRNKSIQYWIYDRLRETDKLVLQHPAWEAAGRPEFSPDGRMLAITKYHDQESAGLYLVDTVTLRRTFVRLPTPHWLSSATAHWSKDGDELLISISGESSRAGREYYSYRPATKRVEKISGRFEEEHYKDTFLRNGQEIGLFDGGWLRSAIYHDSASSPAGKWTAHVGEKNLDMTYTLNVVDKQGLIKTVAIGQNVPCNGNTIDITGWLDDRYLVYRDRDARFVFDTATDSTAELFSEKKRPPLFTW